MKFFHKLFSFLRYILWILFFFIVISLIVGITKYKTIGSYIHFLNTRDRNEVKTTITWQNPTSIFTIFWEQTVSTGDVSGIPEETMLTGEVLSGTEETALEDDSFDPYDPAFQDEFSDSLQGDSDLLIEEAEDTLEETGFGFTTDTTTTTTTDEDSDLLKLIKQHNAAE